MSRTNVTCLRRANARYAKIGDGGWMPIVCEIGAVLVGVAGVLAYVATGIWSYSNTDFGTWLNFAIAIFFIKFTVIYHLVSYDRLNGRDTHILIQAFYNEELNLQKAKRRPLGDTKS